MPAPERFVKGRTHNNVSVPNGGTSNVDLSVGGWRWLTLIARLKATTTPGDLTLSVRLYDDTGAVLAGPPITGELVIASAADGSDVVTIVRYVVTGVDKVQVRVVNANAGAKNLDVSYWLSVEAT